MANEAKWESEKVAADAITEVQTMLNRIKNSEKAASDLERVRSEAKQYQEAVESHR